MADLETPGLVGTPCGDNDHSFSFKTPLKSRDRGDSGKFGRSSWLSPSAGPTKLVSPYGSDDASPQYSRVAQPLLTPAAKVGLKLRKVGSVLTSPFAKSPKTRSPRNTLNGHTGHLMAPPTSKSWALRCMIGSGLLLVGLFSYSYIIPQNPLEQFHFRPNIIPNSLSDLAVKSYREAYGGDKSGWLLPDDPMNPGSIFVLMDLVGEVDDGTLVDATKPIFQKVKDFAVGYEDYLLSHIKNISKQKEVALASEGRESGASSIVKVDSYFSLLSRSLPHIAKAQFTSSDGRAMLIEIKVSIPHEVSPGDSGSGIGLDGTTTNFFMDSVLDAIVEYGNTKAPAEVRLGYTGLPFFESDLKKAGDRDTKEFKAIEEMLPSSSPSLKTYGRMAELFGWGRISPYRILFSGKNTEKVLDTEEGFIVMQRVMRALAEVDVKVDTEEEKKEEEFEMVRGIAAVNMDSIPQRIEDGHMTEHLDEVMDELFGEVEYSSEVNPGELMKPHKMTTYDGIAFLRNNIVPFPVFLGAHLCAKNNKPNCPIEFLHMFVDLTSTVTSGDGMATYITATLGVDPFSQHGITWLKASRSKLLELSESNQLEGYSVTIGGGAAIALDATENMEKRGKPFDAMKLSYGLIVLFLGSSFFHITSIFASGHNRYNGKKL